MPVARYSLLKHPSAMMSLTVTFAHGPVVTKCLLSGDS